MKTAKESSGQEKSDSHGDDGKPAECTHQYERIWPDDGLCGILRSAGIFDMRTGRRNDYWRKLAGVSIPCSMYSRFL